ncbi:orotidine 5'-phosphate decarboxylase / HUMPS family protein [Silvanigrella aquatica]|uniref:Orotidine 5'-phosphate decarboxylase n=1 Tax=Silvanigrella aquatica TaxID=1915309 RepID=A0A1L4CZK3_9BACT|nr:orotidine 5'-phosphate decarboxylase / HUMPS family protein [Silvanigrella aquatica]APJ03393.1 hypothetical protein AXG55_05525 [Silvanigrella aquatica]
MKNHPNLKLCLGIDPNPNKNDLESFRDSVYKHMEILDFCSSSLEHRVIKPQLAYFLSYGSSGILLLEELIARFQKQYTIILDAKFNDISTSFKAYLNFVFHSLGAHGVTLSPFLGEKTIQMAYEEGAKHCGKKARSFVLCATSESSQGHLSFIQSNWKKTLLACSEIRNEIFQGEESLYCTTGVVVAANRNEVLFSDELKESNLSVLAPGLGVQSSDWNVIRNCSNHPNEIIFPFSRAIFSGGNIPIESMNENLITIQQYF